MPLTQLPPRTPSPRVWGGVPLCNPDFVGRGPVLEQLRAQLTESRETVTAVPVALHGMSGVGKTQVAIEYVHRYADEYELVWWIDARCEAAITASLTTLAQRLRLDADHPDAVLELLATGLPDWRWILVFDGADTLADIRPLLPSGRGHTIVTSRNAEWGGCARTIEVGVFSREESTELLRRRTRGGLTDGDAQLLATALGDLPLAVEQAASWRVGTAMPATDYVELLETSTAKLLETGATGGYELPVAAAWDVSLDWLARDHPVASQLFQLCAFFGPEPIDPGWLKPHDMDRIVFGTAVSVLRRHSLAWFDDRHRLRVHRLVQTVVRARLTEERRAELRHDVHLALARADRDGPEVRSGRARPSPYDELLPHALATRAHECDDERVATFWANLGDHVTGLSTPPRSREVHRTVLVVDVRGFGHPARTRHEMVAVREATVKVLRAACEKSWIPWERCRVEQVGDSVLVLAHADVPKNLFVDQLPGALLAELDTHNAINADGTRIELRLALHAGELTESGTGVTGRAIVVAHRLLDAQPVKDALADGPGPLAVVVSEWFYDEVVRQRDEHHPDSYRPIRVVNKETAADAWLRLPADEPETEAVDGALVQNLREGTRTFRRVVDMLEELPCLRDGRSRAEVIARLGPSVDVAYFESRRAHLTSIVSACLAVEGGLADLAHAVEHAEPADSQPVKRLMRLLFATG